MTTLFTFKKTSGNVLMFFLLLAFYIPAGHLKAQTVTCTGTSVSYWSTTPGCIVFGIRNTNAYPIRITDMSNYMIASNTNNFSLWYHATTTTGVPADITTANGWVLAINGPSVTNGTTAGVVPILSGINLVIPANTTYRLALVGNVQSPHYTTSGTGGSLFTAGGVEVYAQSNATSPTYVGYYPGPVSNTPRGFNGTITFVTAVVTAPGCVANPIAPANGNTTVCSGNTVLRWNKASGATGYDVYLNTGAGPATTVVSTNQPDTFYNAITVPGQYSWKVIPKNTAGDASGCNNWNFTVIPGITPDVTIKVETNDTLCGGSPATFTATPVNGGNNPAYQWFKNNAPVGTNNPVYVDNALVNNDVIKVVLTSNAAGCLSASTDTSNSIKMTILPNPQASLSASGPTAFCYGGSVKIDGPGGGLTYQWMHNGVPLAGATSSSYTATYSGYYNVKITTSAFCPAISDSINVIVYPSPFPLVDRNGNVLTTATFYTSYQWYRNNQPIAGATTNSITVSRDGHYKVIVTDIANCGGSSVDVPVNSLSIPLVSAKDIHLYPNPASNQVTINAPIKTDIVLRSIDGKTVLSAKQVNGFDVSKLSAGIYILYLSDHNGQLLKTEKLVKKQD